MTTIRIAASHLRTRTILAAIVAFASSIAVASLEAKAAEPADLFRAADAGSQLIVDHSIWDGLLKAYVKVGPDGLNRVDYAGFKAKGQPALKNYITQLQAVEPSTLNRAEQFALLANLYNAKTIDIVLDHYPVASIKNISLGGGLFAAFTGGPWKAKVLSLRNVAMSLDDIEHGILRPLFKDPRVHYAVNCASIGCPNLQPDAFTGDQLNAQLDAAARAFVNHPRGARIANNGLIVSSIYSWFKSDFGGTDDGVIQHLKGYAGPSLSAKLRSVAGIANHEYDWTLNDVR